MAPCGRLCSGLALLVLDIRAQTVFRKARVCVSVCVCVCVCLCVLWVTLEGGPTA